MSTPQPPDQGIPNPRVREKRSVPWRRDPTIIERLAVVERLHLAGTANVHIGAELGVDESTVRLDLRRLGELWIERLGEEQAVLRGRRIRQLEEIARRAIAAAEFDLAAEKAVLFGIETEVDGVRHRVIRDLRETAQFRGNKAAALNVARAATMDIAKLQGLIVDKVAPVDAEGKTLDLASLVMLARAGAPVTEPTPQPEPARVLAAVGR